MKKGRISLILSIVLMALALFVTAVISLKGNLPDSAFFRAVASGFSWLGHYVNFSASGASAGMIPFALLLLAMSIMILAGRGRKILWIFIPLGLLLFETAYLFFALRTAVDVTNPLLVFFMEKGQRTGAFLLVLIFATEVMLTVGVFFFVRFLLRRRKKKEAEKIATAYREEVTETPKTLSRKEQKRLKKAEKGRQRDEDAEEAMVTHGRWDGGYREDRVQVNAGDYDDTPLIFPELIEIPRLKKYATGVNSDTSFVNNDYSDTPSSIGASAFVAVRREAEILAEKQSVPKEETPDVWSPYADDRPSRQEEKQKESKWGLFAPRRLTKKLSEDEQASRQPYGGEVSEGVEAVTAMPSQIQYQPRPSQKVDISTDPYVIDSPFVQPAVPQDEELPEIEGGTDDIDVVSGVGGLVKGALYMNKRYQFPPADLLDRYPDHSSEIDEPTRLAGEILIQTLQQFKVEAELKRIVKGPTVTMYEVFPAPGIRVNTIVNLADNIALSLAAQRVRIVAPIPGKQAVGIEVPNKQRQIIGFREMLSSMDAKPFQIPMVLGKTITGTPVVTDLAGMPHLLIAGATGSGKSVCVNSLICSILYRKSPKDVRMILVDPKIVELKIYNGIPHLLTPVITEAKKTIKALEFCLYEMDRRYKLLQGLNVRNIMKYNEKIVEQRIAREKLPYIVVVIDEFADLMATVGKELETLLARLAAMARAIGIHLVLATQRPSVNVITGIIKSNIPTRIAFSVASVTDSRIIIDEMGADKLLGRGDMLFSTPAEPASTRIQGAFLSDDEVEKVVAFAKTQGVPDYLDEAFFEDDEPETGHSDEFFEDADDGALLEQAWKIVVERQSASASYLQRRLKIGYNRAARLVEQMEENGWVGPQRGSKPREILKYPD